MDCLGHSPLMPKIEFSNYEGGREQAYVKHCLLENYLAQLVYRVGQKWDAIVYVDAFAGPWGAKDTSFADASFGIAMRVLKDAVAGLKEKYGKTARGLCIFVEKKPAAFARLNAFAQSASTENVRAIALRGRFIEKLPEIQKLVARAGSGPFKFVFLDQKGWAAAPIKDLRQFVAERSCEILFNLMTSFLTRFVDTETRAESYDRLFGRRGVLERIRCLPKGTGEREEAAVKEYCKSLREICGFRYVAEAVILDPKKEKIRYYLVFATNHPRGIEVFKSAEMSAAKMQDEVRYEARVRKTKQEELVFDQAKPKSPKADQMRSQYCSLARAKVIEILSRVRPGAAVDYDVLYREAMPFPLVTPSDLQKWIIELSPNVKVRLAGSERRRKPQPDKSDRVIVANPAVLK
jgi:three-Cys-motif partner protein